MKIFIDFDDVLFHTKEFRKDFRDIFLRLGISEELFLQTYEKTRSAGNGMRTYDFEKHLRALRNESDFNEAFLRKQTDLFLSDCGRYIFPDAPAFLETLKKDGFEVVLVSFGTTDFQERKVFGSGIKHFVDDIRVGNIHKGREIRKLLSEEGNFWFLDDRVDYIEGVKRINPHVKTILVTRPEGRYADIKNEWCDFEVQNLEEARSIIFKKEC